MILSAWPYLLATLATVLCALAVHTRLRGFLPEDPPGPARKRHPRPMPMLGTAPALVAIVACVAEGAMPLALAVASAASTGLIDDLRKSRGHDGLDWRIKALGHVVATACVLYTMSPTSAHLVHTLALGLALFCLINAFNFLDNQDGVSTTLGVSTLAAVAWRDGDPLAATLAAAWLGFLPFNWPSARAFLGDAGAYALGACATALALRPAAGPSPEWLAALAPVAVPAFDFVQVVAVRLVLGYAPWKGDRRHVTHLLLLLGIPRVALAPLLGAVGFGTWLVLR